MPPIAADRDYRDRAVRAARSSTQALSPSSLVISMAASVLDFPKPKQREREIKSVPMTPAPPKKYPAAIRTQRPITDVSNTQPGKTGMSSRRHRLLRGF